MSGRLCRLLAATVLVAAGSTAVAAPPASAASCPTAAGVTVVVDFHELGGGVRAVCDVDGGGRYASAVFAESGVSLTRVQREPGFVCRVDDAPSPDQDPCVNTPPADAYWGLWWSSGTSGTWSYASTGVDSLKLPAGGSVALSWNGGSTKSPPGATPPSSAASPSPSATPSPTSASPGPGGASTGPSGGHPHGGDHAPGSTSGTTGGSGPSASVPPASAGPSTRAAPAPRAAHAARRAGTHHRVPGTARHQRQKASDPSSPSSSPTSGAVAGASARATAVTAARAPSGPDAAPGWIAPAVIGGLFAAAAGTALVRRRRGLPGA